MLPTQGTATSHEAARVRPARAPHEEAHLLEALHESIHLVERSSRPNSDTATARHAQERRVASLGRCHREDDRLRAPELTARCCRLGLSRHAAHPWDHLHDLADRAKGGHLPQLCEKVVKGEITAFDALLVELRGCTLLCHSTLLNEFGERIEVTHVKDPSCDAIWVEALKGV
jgi:hypothetical protein